MKSLSETQTDFLFVMCSALTRETVSIYVIFLRFCLFVCVEVLRPSQPNGVMSSAVSLPNHMFTGQA